MLWEFDCSKIDRLHRYILRNTVSPVDWIRPSADRYLRMYTKDCSVL